MGPPATLVNAALFGGATLLLALLAQFPRAAAVYPLFVVGALWLGFQQGVLHPAWASASLLADAPWALVAPVVALQVGLVLLGPWMLRWSPLRLVWFAAASPVVAGHPRARALLDAVAPDRVRRAVAVLFASGLTVALPVISPAAGATGLRGSLLAASGAIAVPALAWLLTLRRPPVAASPAPAYPRSGPLVAVLFTVPLAAVVVWLAIASGAVEWYAYGLEQSIVYLPRITVAGVTFSGALLGLLGEEGLGGVIVNEGLARALALRGDAVPQMLAVGLAVGSGLPALLATRSSLRWGLPLWFAQVAWVVGSLQAR